MSTPETGRDLLLTAIEAAYGYDPAIEAIALRLWERDDSTAAAILGDALRRMARRDLKDWRPNGRAGLLAWMFRCDLMQLERSAWEETARYIIDRAYGRQVMDWAL